jgi:hypothetical protein
MPKARNFSIGPIKKGCGDGPVTFSQLKILFLLIIIYFETALCWIVNKI